MPQGRYGVGRDWEEKETHLHLRGKDERQYHKGVSEGKPKKKFFYQQKKKKNHLFRPSTCPGKTRVFLAYLTVEANDKKESRPAEDTKKRLGLKGKSRVQYQSISRSKLSKPRYRRVRLKVEASGFVGKGKVKKVGRRKGTLFKSRK